MRGWERCWERKCGVLGSDAGMISLYRAIIYTPLLPPSYSLLSISSLYYHPLSWTPYFPTFLPYCPSPLYTITHSAGHPTFPLSYLTVHLLSILSHTQLDTPLPTLFTFTHTSCPPPPYTTTHSAGHWGSSGAGPAIGTIPESRGSSRDLPTSRWLGCRWAAPEPRLRRGVAQSPPRVCSPLTSAPAGRGKSE